MTHPRSLRIALVLATLLRSSLSAAQNNEDQRAAARRLLLEQAQEAADRGDHSQALSYAQRAGQLQMTPSLRLFVAREQQALGNVTAAFGAADLCVRDTQRDHAAARREEILQQCQELLASLRSRVAMLRVHAPEQMPAGAVVHVGSSTLDPTLFDVPYPVDPGTVTVTATAPGMRPFRTEEAVEAGRETVVSLQFSPEVTVSEPPRPRSEVSRWIGAPVLGSAGILGIGLGIGFFVARQNALGSGCIVHETYVQCATQEQRDIAQREAPGWGVAATAAFISGGVLIAAGGAWAVTALLLSPRPRSSEQAQHHWQPVLSPGYVGVRGAL